MEIQINVQKEWKNYKKWFLKNHLNLLKIVFIKKELKNQESQKKIKILIHFISIILPKYQNKQKYLFITIITLKSKMIISIFFINFLFFLLR